jgi:hypothetical protein
VSQRTNDDSDSNSSQTHHYLKAILRELKCLNDTQLDLLNKTEGRCDPPVTKADLVELKEFIARTVKHEIDLAEERLIKHFEKGQATREEIAGAADAMGKSSDTLAAAVAANQPGGQS